MTKERGDAFASLMGSMLWGEKWSRCMRNYNTNYCMSFPLKKEKHVRLIQPNRKGGIYPILQMRKLTFKEA